MLVSNSSTLILLAKCSALKAFLDRYAPVLIPDEVKREMLGKQSLDEKMLARAIQNKKLVVERVNRKELSNFLAEFRLDEGEAAAYALSKKVKAEAVLTDDLELIKLCRLEGKPFLSSMAIILRLNELKILSREDALSKLEKLMKHGRYSRQLYEKFKSEVK